MSIHQSSSAYKMALPPKGGTERVYIPTLVPTPERSEGWRTRNVM